MVYLYLIETSENEIIPLLSLFTISNKNDFSLNKISLSITGYKYRKPSIDIIYNEYKKIEKFKLEKDFEKNSIQKRISAK